MDIFVAAALKLIMLTGPGGQLVEINPDAIVSIRGIRSNAKEHWASGTACLVFTNDGKVVAVQETCADVSRIVAETRDRR